jgi:hypothetical protein
MTNSSWIQFSISRSVSDDNGKLGIDRWQPAGLGEYANLLVAELKDTIDTGKLTFIDLEPYNNDAFYTLTALLKFDPTEPDQVKALLEDFKAKLALALPERAHFDIDAIVIKGFTFQKEALLNSSRDPFTTDLHNLASTLEGMLPLTSTWFEFQVNEKDLQGDTLIPVIDAQVARMEEQLAFAKAQPFKGTGGNRSHDRQTRVIFMNTAAKDGKMSALLREKVVEGEAQPEDIIGELKGAREALIELTKRADFKGKPPRLNPGQEVYRLARDFGPTLDRGGAQMRPDYLERTLADFPLDSVNGKMMRYGMFLASQLAMEIIEGAGGTVNISDFHKRLANELGATVTPPSPSIDEDYVQAPSL